MAEIALWPKFIEVLRTIGVTPDDPHHLLVINKLIELARPNLDGAAQQLTRESELRAELYPLMVRTHVTAILHTLAHHANDSTAIFSVRDVKAILNELSMMHTEKEKLRVAMMANYETALKDL